jgi:hypothetical protein
MLTDCAEVYMPAFGEKAGAATAMVYVAEAMGLLL